MTVKRSIFFILVLLMVYPGFSADEVRIKLLSFSSSDLKDNPQVKFKSQGIATVPVGQSVYLAADTGKLQPVSFQWSLEKPGNSGTVLSNYALPNPWLAPDLEGQYLVTLTVTLGSGVSLTASLWITAGTFVGNGTVVNTETPAQCIRCHQAIVNTWKTTPHADAFRRDLDGKLSYGYYRIYCFYCHGPDSNKPKIWAAMEKKQPYHYEGEQPKDIFEQMLRDLPGAANLTGVQCESCHGPGSQHVGKIDKNQVSNSLSPGVCTICHDTGDPSSPGAQWVHSPHAGSMDTVEEQERMNHAAGITCAACHDPHDANGKDSMLRAGKVEKACSGCHGILVQNDRQGFSSCPQGFILQGKGGMVIGRAVYPPGKHSQVKKGCVGCHMAKSPQGLAQVVGGHTFRVITKGQADPVINTNGCLECHKSMNLELVRKFQDNIKQLMKELSALLPQREVKSSEPWEEPKLPQDPSLSKMQSAAAYNYYLVLKDGTFGVHNPMYIKRLLEVSIVALKEEKKGH